MKWLENSVYETDTKITQWKSDIIYRPTKINQQEDHDVSAFDEQLNGVMNKKLEKVQDPILDVLASGEFDYGFLVANKEFLKKNYTNDKVIADSMVTFIKKVISDTFLKVLFEAKWDNAFDIKLSTQFVITTNQNWVMTLNADQCWSIGEYIILGKIDIFDFTKENITKYIFKKWDHVQVEPIVMPPIRWYIDNYDQSKWTFQLFSLPKRLPAAPWKRSLTFSGSVNNKVTLSQ
jgi:hypothetical protein